jgi:hypothetical protein
MVRTSPDYNRSYFKIGDNDYVIVDGIYVLGEDVVQVIISDNEVCDFTNCRNLKVCYINSSRKMIFVVPDSLEILEINGDVEIVITDRCSLLDLSTPKYNSNIPTLKELVITRDDVEEFTIPQTIETLIFVGTCKILKGHSNCRLKHLTGRFERLPRALLNLETLDSNNYICFTPNLKQIYSQFTSSIGKIYPAKVKVTLIHKDEKYKRSKNTETIADSRFTKRKDVSYDITARTKNKFLLKICKRL